MVYSMQGDALFKVYNISGDSHIDAYDINGNQVLRKHNVSNSYTNELILSMSDIPSGTQGIACDSLSQDIAQLYTGGIVTININTGEWTRRASVFDLGHGSAGQFAPQKIQQSDLYPSLYVSTQHRVTIGDIQYNKLYEVYVGESNSVLNREFYVPIVPNTGGLSAIDFEKNILYQVCNEAYEPSDGATYDYTYINAVDMTKFEPLDVDSIAVNGAYVYTDVIDSFTVPYIQAMQSLTFFDGLIVCLSDYPTYEGRVIFIEPTTKSVYLTLNKDIAPFEREGIGFIRNPETGQMDMILSSRHGTFVYYRYQFNL